MEIVMQYIILGLLFIIVCLIITAAWFIRRMNKKLLYFEAQQKKPQQSAKQHPNTSFMNKLGRENSKGTGHKLINSDVTSSLASPAHVKQFFFGKFSNKPDKNKENEKTISPESSEIIRTKIEEMIKFAEMISLDNFLTLLKIGYPAIRSFRKKHLSLYNQLSHYTSRVDFKSYSDVRHFTEVFVKIFTKINSEEIKALHWFKFYGNSE